MNWYNDEEDRKGKEERKEKKRKREKEKTEGNMNGRGVWIERRL